MRWARCRRRRCGRLTRTSIAALERAAQLQRDTLARTDVAACRPRCCFAYASPRRFSPGRKARLRDSPRTTDRSSVESGDVDAVADRVAALIERGYIGPSTQRQSARMAFDRAEPVMFFSRQAGISSLDED